MTSQAIVVEGLGKVFGTFTAVDDVSFEAADGAITALLGPSGSGKSTVLRMIAGLEQPDGGRIWVDGEEHTNKTPQERRLLSVLARRGLSVGLFDKHVESGADINFEMLFTPPEFFRVIGSPRPHLGGSLNTNGKTNDGYFGLTWGITLIQNLFGWGGSVFANGSLGGALQDGFSNSAPPHRKRLGSTALFRESVELGYQLTPNLSVSGFVDHMSNANLAPHNAGITDAGARLGFKF